MRTDLSEFKSLVCSACGASGHANCDCGAPYVPKGTRAAEAIKANPHKSDRALAEELGVGNATVSRARRASTVSRDTVRTGLDGKKRKQPKKRRRLPSVTLESALDPLFLRLSEAAAGMDRRPVKDVIAGLERQYAAGLGLGIEGVERLEFIRDWLTALIEGMKPLVVSCQPNIQET